MPVDLTTLIGEVYEVLNASPAAFGTLADPRRHASEISTAILDADEAVIVAGLENPAWGHRATFVAASSAIAHGGAVPAHYGAVEKVVFTITGGLYAGTKAGDEAPRDVIELDNLNPNGLTRIPPRYALEQNTLWHNAAGLILGGASGVTVVAHIATFTRTPACQSPSGLSEAVKSVALGSLVGKEGIKTEAAGMWVKKGLFYLAQQRGQAMAA
jgi:hypothetical protein